MMLISKLLATQRDNQMPNNAANEEDVNEVITTALLNTTDTRGKPCTCYNYCFSTIEVLLICLLIT